MTPGALRPHNAAMAAPAPKAAPLPDYGSEIAEIGRETVGWLRTDALDVLIGGGIAIGLFLLFRAAVDILGRRLKSPSGEPVSAVRTLARRALLRTGNFFLAMLAVRIVAHFVVPRGQLFTALVVLFTIAAVLQGARWVREIVIGLIERRAGRSEDDSTLDSAMGIITIIVNVVVWIIAFILILSNIGVDVTALVAGLGIGGIAIGLAAQGIFSDLFAALSIILDQPFRRGETIGFSGNVATIEEIGLKTTRMRSLSGEQLIVSNANLLGQVIQNYSRFTHRRVVMPLQLIYQTPPVLLHDLPEQVGDIVRARPRLTFDRAYFSKFNPSSIDFELVFIVNDSDMGVMLAEQQAVALAIMDLFARQGISFAYPTQAEFSIGPDGKYRERT